jgi:hypothetical protein
MTLGRDMMKPHLNTYPTQSMWFERFAKGCLKHIGQEVEQDLAVSIHLMITFQELLESEWGSVDETQRLNLAFIGAFSFIALVGSFQGHEVFLVENHGLLKYAKEEQVEIGDMLSSLTWASIRQRILRDII